VWGYCEGSDIRGRTVTLKSAARCGPVAQHRSPPDVPFYVRGLDRMARYADLTGAPDESGAKRREQGLAKAGNARVRRGMINSPGDFCGFNRTAHWPRLPRRPMIRELLRVATMGKRHVKAPRCRVRPRVLRVTGINLLILSPPIGLDGEHEVIRAFGHRSDNPSAERVRAVPAGEEPSSHAACLARTVRFIVNTPRRAQ
jgi:hypothetical protein